MRNISYIFIAVAILTATLLIPSTASAQEDDTNFEGLKAVVGADRSVTLVWNLGWWETPAITPDIGLVQPSGSIVVNPEKTTTYVLSVERYMMGAPTIVKWEVTVIAEPE
jgi:hypothetical protein